MVTRMFVARARGWTVGAALAAGLILSACSSSAWLRQRYDTRGRRRDDAASGGTSSITVATRSGPLGTYLTDGSGKTLYMFASDTPPSRRALEVACRFGRRWEGKATAGSGVTVQAQHNHRNERHRTGHVARATPCTSTQRTTTRVMSRGKARTSPARSGGSWRRPERQSRAQRPGPCPRPVVTDRELGAGR